MTVDMAASLDLYRRGRNGALAPILIIGDRHAGFQRREDKGLPHGLGRHAARKPGAAEIDRPLLMDAVMDRPVGDECIKRILR
ncbi:hypothetical protein AOG23_16375 [Rhizobium acidisoli]|nr:hypothetical protein AOG23_16375 [Rhizobium acidisoli]